MRIVDPMTASPHDELAAALLDPERAVPAVLTSHTARTPARRFAVYRNNVTVGLIDALRARFPAVERIVGEDFFAATARDFVRVRPPRSPLLSLYGDDFPDFVAAFAPAGDLPWLADVARLEAARTTAYHAADAPPLGPAEFAALDPASLGDLRVTLHPSARLVRSRYPIVTIWAMNSGEAALGPVDIDTPEDALVIRPRLTVVVQRLPPGAAVFLASLSEHATLAEASTVAFATTAAFDPTASLAVLVGSGVTTSLSFDPEPSP